MPVTAQDADSEKPVGRAADVIARQIRRRIIRGELLEGEVLPGEPDLLTQFGVSRPTLREAIRVLESESLIVVKRGARGGIEVSVPRVEKAAHYAGLLLEYRQATVDDVFAAAAAMEGPCVAMLARNRTAGQLRTLRDAVEEESRAVGEPARLLELQNDFHRTVLELAGNETLAVLCHVLRHIIELATQRYMSGSSDAASHAEVATATRAHATLVELVAERDAAGSEALWRKHLKAINTRLRSTGVAGSVVDLLE